MDDKLTIENAREAIDAISKGKSYKEVDIDVNAVAIKALEHYISCITYVPTGLSAGMPGA